MILELGKLSATWCVLQAMKVMAFDNFMYRYAQMVCGNDYANINCNNCKDYNHNEQKIK